MHAFLSAGFIRSPMRMSGAPLQESAGPSGRVCIRRKQESRPVTCCRGNRAWIKASHMLIPALDEQVPSQRELSSALTLSQKERLKNKGA